MTRPRTDDARPADPSAPESGRSRWAPLRIAAAAGLLAVSLVACTAVASVDTEAEPTAASPATPSASATPSLEDQAAALPDPEPAPPVDAAAAAAAQPQTALATAVLLPVKGRAPKTGYDRDLYGQAWKDVDRNGCDTRNDILRRDLTDQVLKPGTNGCVVASGTLLDPYSGKPIAFVRGQDTSSAVQIDHVVALSDSWQKGAQQWDTAKREAFGNDPLNLLAADGPLNQQKGDGDTATWLPPNKAFRCAYVARQVGVKYTYGLWVTQAEQDAMVGVLSTCPAEPLPAGSAVPPPPVVEAPAVVVVPPVVEQPAAPAVAAPAAPVPAVPAPAPAPAPAPVTGPFANCTEAWAAGAAPVYIGSPGYAPKLDRDNDGIGCEKRP
ncbi:GmrSD restriction endonuclease domain-containing protein [Cellulomonas humilata]|uniref:Pyruvate/2-oxoglutarate dehydrogenase complex dihydrolipoamide acyltransferase (E2) component n=1 Tax=Cellulomonas humilata TaxID=144055 RepID=A0ABU0EB42_9CELL|nr:DUF1524 domain-containing protein [Cellulomonas humilata]MDQ0372476.1 pyruvate/2-oxoglutarate dehydrogenase complex dihydrolipoamide acyltransferase (E2) component [Cellulomonas humilata]